MASRAQSAVENNFTKGLVTEFTGLNFPENAATDCDNVCFDVIGNVKRRLGVTFEENFTDLAFETRTGNSVNTYKWNNAGGDGSTQFVVVQIGGTVVFYESSEATDADPLSTTKIVSQIVMSGFTAAGGSFDSTLECQFTDGNGYLFIFHPSCDPVYCTYSGGAVTGAPIDVKIRDFTGVIDGLPDNTRPSTLSDAHNYNIQNQGWTNAPTWTTTSSSAVTITTGAKVFTIPAGITAITPGDVIVANGYSSFGVLFGWMGGTVTSYVGTTLTLNITGVATPYGSTGPFNSWVIDSTSQDYIDDWFTSQGNYPSNADQWWRFKNSSGVFDPATTQPNVSLSLGPAPKGHFILSAFNQSRSLVSSVDNITDVVTDARPTHGTWFQGRIWYTGVNASQAASGTAPFTTWTENIYFSQVVNKVEDFGKCYQTNDPTSEELFDLLPTDGGVIVIQGCGPIYRLFPIQNGMLVFAANGVWFITGSQGIGFAATDYTITKISSITSLSTSSFVDVMGLPYFWNEDGIYAVQPQQGGGLAVNSMTYSTIGQFYDAIPLDSKKYARGAYNPIDYIIQWIYRSEDTSDVVERYEFDKILNYNVYNKAFFPYTVNASLNGATINGINYVQNPGGSGAPESMFKYFTTIPVGGSYTSTFADEHSTDYIDWGPTGLSSVNYESYFITGYRVHGDAQRRFQMPYFYVYSRPIDDVVAYKIQGQWDYATSGDTGRWSTLQLVQINQPNYGTVFRRHVIRGRGMVLQIKVTSVTGEPFDIIGWSAYETQNTGV